jgi:hypothetical protein
MASNYSYIRLDAKKPDKAITIEHGNATELITNSLASIIHTELLSVKKLR